jgi:hypothetical protein
MACEHAPRARGTPLHRLRKAARAQLGLNHPTLIILRFTGGPFDGQRIASRYAAESYRLGGGAYLVDHQADASDGAVVYTWYADGPPRWHDAPAGIDS